MKPRNLAIGGLIALAAPLAADSQGERPGGSRPGAVQPGEPPLAQKELLVRKLIEDSTRRVTANPSEAAQRHLAGAREQQAEALAALKTGDFPGAEQHLHAAMRAATEALRLAPDPRHRTSALEERYARLQAGVEALTASYGRHLLRARGLPPGAPLPADAELARAGGLTDRARALAGEQRPDEAARLLGEAEQVLLRALPGVLGTETLDYAQRFETQAEEYTYEAERHRSYLALVPLALAELRPAPEAALRVERHVSESRALLEAARRLAEGKNYAEALKNVRAGTGRLQQALTAAGLALPGESKTE